MIKYNSLRPHCVSDNMLGGVTREIRLQCCNKENAIHRIQCYRQANIISKKKHGSFSIISFLYIPTVADDVAIGLLKLQINWVIWFIQIKKKQHFLANYCTYLRGKSRRWWNELLRISREDQRASPNSQTPLRAQRAKAGCAKCYH